MRKYSEYKDSGVQWMGEVPKHWQRAKVSRLFKQIGSGTTPSSGDTSLYADEGTPWLQSGDFNNNEICHTSKFITKKALDNYSLKIYNPGGVVIAMYGASIGKVGLLNIAATVNQACCVLSDSDLLLQKYAFYVFVNEKENLIKKSKGGTQPNISQEIIKSHYIPLPPLSEQQHIVSFLDKKTSQIDEYIATKEKEIEALKEWKKALIARVVTKGLNKNAKMKDSGISWIGEVPEHWDIKRLGSAFTENRKLNADMRCTEAYKFNYGALVRKDEDVNPEEMVDTYSKYTVLEPNDIVINGLNLNYDFVSMRVAKAYAEGIITSAYLAMTPRDGIVPNYYLYLFKAMDAMKLFHGMGTGIRLTLSFSEMKKQQILFPPIQEQEAIVDYIDKATTKADKMIVELTYHVEYMKEYKQRLIADVVTGKINVQP